MIEAPSRRIGLLLVGSGFCALVYQVAWLRLLRLVFGSSTAASAAVLAVFMGGLGLGSLILGRLGDRTSNPLLLYALLEGGVAVTAGLTPWIVVGVEATYVSVGGTASLGVGLATGLRLLLAVVLLGIPTFLMGGTLPAAVKAATSRADLGRRALGLLYAANTFGAVAGAGFTTFLFVEALGVRKTIWIAALVNLLVAVVARSMARRRTAEMPGPPHAEGARPGTRVPPGAPIPLVLVAAGVVGFVFFLMELVWYRMLAPLLGGSTYTFGIVLAVALAGIGVGGLVYSFRRTDRRPGAAVFAATCTVEAALLMVPWALGDHLALVAQVLRGLDALGFTGLVVGWSLVAAVVVFPAAVVAGYQFPVLVALLGGGREGVAREVGAAYACNTAGAILGSLAGGFGLLPLLSAGGAWRLGAVSLVVLGIAFAAVAAVGDRRRSRLVLPLAAAAMALLLAVAEGPGALWRHGEIGAGRFDADLEGPSDLERQRRTEERSVVWAADGRESGVALRGSNGYSFTINGKTDGHGRLDAPTQVMSTLIAAALHPEPETGLVIGLGTGSSAGWLAAVPGVERVDVVELEPLILDVAEACTPVNRGAMGRPDVEVFLGDGRELLLTTRERYDIVFSEPSNPYRAGIASLFTADFYRAVSERLAPRGIFVQWLQAYDIDADVVHTVLATMGKVFPHVETWSVHSNDLLLIAGNEPIEHDVGRVSERVASDPLASALQATWGVSGAEGFYAGFLASPGLTLRVQALYPDRVNTDDRPIIEYGFARNLGRSNQFSVDELRRMARASGDHRPEVVRGRLDWDLVDELRSARGLFLEWIPEPPAGADRSFRTRVDARRSFLRGDLGGALRRWDRQGEGPRSHADLLLLGEALAAAGDPRAVSVVAALEELQPTEGAAVRARLLFEGGDPDGAAAALTEAFRSYRTDPWPLPQTMLRSLDLGWRLAEARPETIPMLDDALREPFAIRMFDERRRLLRSRLLSRDSPVARRCVEVFRTFEPHAPWVEAFLEDRWRCYREARDPLADRAARELTRFRWQEPPKLLGRGRGAEGSEP